ncbi:hypothetical protein [Haloprofundus salilacus]|uniref:hypothetical protein n=1 Tax=Haloprofundus salilacus TaxID=2876190 RepID=UPI001CCC77DF|nr:hypothetical protein [Haloprofundus salilacus]
MAVQNTVLESEQVGYSEAVVGTDYDWRGISVRALPKEQQVIDFDAKEQSRAELPGATDTPSENNGNETVEEPPGEADTHSNRVLAEPDGRTPDSTDT